MNRKLLYFIIILILSHCSFDTKSGIWTKSKKIKKEEAPVLKEIFKKSEILEKEINPNIKIKLKSNYKKKSFINNLTNNNGFLNFEGQLNNISKYKFSKIDQFEFVQPDLLFTNDKSIIFFDNKGSILKFNNESKLLWKHNVYKKNEKKLNPILFFSSNNNTLVVADNLANLYALDIHTGNLIWKKNNSAPFNSQIKIFKDKFYVVDFDNVLRCFSIKNGKQFWNFKTEKTFIKSQQKLSLIIHENRVVFINTLGDLSSLDINSGNLFWQTPTQSSSIYENAFSLKNSDLVMENNSIYFSNNKNELFAIDFQSGIFKWKQNVNSSLRSTIINNLLFTISNEGYLIIVDVSNGKIMRMTNIFDRFKDYKKDEIEPTGFIVAKNKIYLSLNNGKLVIINVVNGKSENIIKIDGNKISRPYILDKNMYVIRDNAILKIN